MPRYRIDIEYEGTRYSGWQVQKNARTVQGEIEHALHSVFGTTDLEFQGSGRTDAGVHAIRQTAHLEADTMLAPEIIRTKVNDVLPADINILEVRKTQRNFHARHDALSRSYLYQISRRRTAFGKRYVWWIKDPLNIAAMQEAARSFVGMKDFQSFTDDDAAAKSTKVLMEEVTVKDAGDLILIRVRGSHFLWKLVRRIVGVLAEAGLGTLAPKDIKRLLLEESDAPSRFTAPPSGLFLERVYYAGERQLTDILPVTLVADRRILLDFKQERKHS
jgi:tRNA pseudouridine38-40 synthase